MDEEIKARRERRRRRLEEKISGKNEIQTTLENTEQTIKSHMAQSSSQLLRRDTFTVLKSKSDCDVVSYGEQFDWRSTEESVNDSYELKNSTYSINKTSEESMHETYNLENLQKARDTNEDPPVPAPRKRKLNAREEEKLSSDTDKDVTEIDLDDLRLKLTKPDPKSPESVLKSPNSSNKSFPPVPKPRTTVRSVYEESECEKSKTEHSNSAESLNEKSLNSDSKERPESNELPLIEKLLEETKDSKENGKKSKFMSEFFYQKKKKRKTKSLVSMMKLEKKKIPRISALLKDLKDDEKETKMEEVEDKVDFQMDSPHYPESVQNGQIYVQSKRGFYVMERDEVFKNENAKMENGRNGGMEDSTVKTAILFQSYWSRSMIYFHGILAGFAFGHAATVTAIMMQYNYEPKPFIGVYSCLSLKIHYVFYALIALCIVSCFDRLDIGHMNKKHLQIAWKAPSMWMILCFYVVSFGLSLSNQTAEARFDSLGQVNLTKVWLGSDEQVSLLQWYHTIWARDILVLFAWLLISLTKFPDFLHVHLNNMIKYAEIKSEGINLHRLSRQKTENS